MILPSFVDERFLMHRLRSTSLAGMSAALLAMILFFKHLLIDHYISWELFSLVLFNAVVKMSAMLWYRTRD